MKGHTNNPNGRPPGTPNKATGSLRNKINDFLADNWQQMQKDFLDLEPKDRCAYYERLMKYSLPTLQSTSLTTDFEKMTDEQLEYTIEKLLTNGQTTKN